MLNTSSNSGIFRPRMHSFCLQGGWLEGLDILQICNTFNTIIYNIYDLKIKIRIILSQYRVDLSIDSDTPLQISYLNIDWYLSLNS